MIKILQFIVLLLVVNLYGNTTYTKAVLEKKIYPMGKKIYNLKCQNIDLQSYDSIDILKQEIKQKKLCKNIRGKKLDILTLYLWHTKTEHFQKDFVPDIKLGHKDKCPVCGMFVYKYPRWVAQIVYTKHNMEHRLSFDGVKDLMKFYFDPMAWGKYDKIDINKIKIIVTDYYTQDPIDGFKAYYVLHSDIYGPMGNELIPFESLEDAKDFKIDHNGKSIIKFDKITKQAVYELDE